LFFSAPIVLQYSQIAVIDSEGITTSIKEDLAEGTYTINTKVLSAVDGHAVDNSVVFGVGEDTTTDSGLVKKEQEQHLRVCLSLSLLIIHLVELQDMLVRS